MLKGFPDSDVISARPSVDESFGAHLLAKRAMVLAVGDQCGFEVAALVGEVDRQIKQASNGCFINGDGVTKSGIED